MVESTLLYSSTFFPNSARSHSLLRGSMTSSIKTVFAKSFQEENIVESVTSKGNASVDCWLKFTFTDL